MKLISEVAQQAYDALSESAHKDKYKLFMKEFNKLVKSNTKQKRNDVGCVISDDCSFESCYRYAICTFKRKCLT